MSSGEKEGGQVEREMDVCTHTGQDGVLPSRVYTTVPNIALDGEEEEKAIFHEEKIAAH